MENTIKGSFLNIRVTEEQKSRLVKEASIKKVSISKLANVLIDKYFEQKNFKPKPIPTLAIDAEKPKDSNQSILMISIFILAAILWIFTSNRPYRNDYEMPKQEV